MPKLPAAKTRDVLRFLERNGFILDHISGSHHIFYHPVSKRRAVGPDTIGSLQTGTLLSLLREAGFNRKEFIEFMQSE